MFDTAKSIVEGTTREDVLAWVQSLPAEQVVGQCKLSTKCVLANYWAHRIFNPVTGDTEVKSLQVCPNGDNVRVTLHTEPPTDPDSHWVNYPYEDRAESVSVYGGTGTWLSTVATEFDHEGDSGADVTASTMLDHVFSRADDALAEYQAREQARAMADAERKALADKYPAVGGALAGCACNYCTMERTTYQATAQEQASTELTTIG